MPACWVINFEFGDQPVHHFPREPALEGLTHDVEFGLRFEGPVGANNISTSACFVTAESPFEGLRGLDGDGRIGRARGLILTPR